MARVQVTGDNLVGPGVQAVLFWAAWLVGTCAGWLLTAVLLQLTPHPVLTPFQLAGTVAIAGAGAGAATGALQAGVLRRWLFDPRVWLWASAAGSALAGAAVVAGPAVVAWADTLSPFPDRTVAGALWEITAGGIVVTAAILLVAASQWLILRRGLQASDRWSRLVLLIGVVAGAFVLGSALGLGAATARGGATAEAMRDVAPWIALWSLGLLAASIFLAAAMAVLLYQADAWASTAGLATQRLELPEPPVMPQVRQPVPRPAAGRCALAALIALLLSCILLLPLVARVVGDRFACSAIHQSSRTPTCRMSLGGHTAAVESVRFAPDGRTFASADDAGQVRVWHVTGGAYVRSLPGDRVAYAPDGRLLATADHMQITLWRAADGARLATLAGHTGWVLGLAFSPDGTLLASAGFDKTVRVWRVADGALVQTLRGHTAYVYGVAFAPDGARLASFSYDGTVRLWTVPSGHQALTIPTSGAIVYSIAFSPDGVQLVSAQLDGTIRIWSAADGRAIRVIQAYPRDLNVMSVRFTPDGTRIIAAGMDGQVGLWTAGGRWLRSFRASSADVRSLDISPDGRILATGSADGTLRLWDLGRP